MVQPAVALLVASALVLLGLVAYAWRNREEPAALTFLVLLVPILVWTLGYAVALTQFDRGARLFWRNVQWFGIAFVPAVWLAFTLDYAGHDDLLTRKTLAALAVVPTLTVLVAWTAPTLMWRESTLVPTAGLAIVTREFGPWYWANLAFAYVGFVGGTVVLLSVIWTAKRLYTDQIAMLVVGGAIAWVGNVVSTFRLGPVPMDYTPFAFTLTAVLFGHAVFRYRLLGSIPASLHSGRDTVVAEMEEGVLVLDRDDRVIDANPVAGEALGLAPDAAVGRALADVASFDAEALADGGRVAVTGPDDRRQYAVSSTTTEDRHGRQLGRIVVLRDVTLQREYEQRLSVVNRILRHNLRNDMTTILGNAEHVEHLAETNDPPAADAYAASAARIRETAEDLSAIATKARKIVSTLEDQPETTTVDLVPTAEQVLREARRNYPAATVEADLPETLAVRAVPQLETAIRVLVDNALEHNDADDPRVRLSLEALDEDRLRLEVADNGPGIPDEEVTVLTRGTESPLHHGSGLGLWLVHWLVAASGGDLAFADNRPRGSVVTLTLERA